jgi:hypothetical protein
MYFHSEKIIKKIQSLESFYNATYYYHTLKEPIWKLLNVNADPPYFLQGLCKSAKKILTKEQITNGQVLLFLANINQGQFYYFCNLYLTSYFKDISFIEAAEILDGDKRFPNDSIIDSDYLIAALILHSINKFDFANYSLQICANEEFHYEINDYKLTKVNSIEFISKGFIYDDKFYLYNRFIPQDKFQLTDKMPAIFKVLSEETPIETADFYLRLDERLAVPKDYAIHASINFEKFRGINFSFDKTNLQENKTIIVHWNPETYDKLLMVIKKDFDDNLNEDVWHVEVEELPYCNNRKLESVCVSFIHGMYYPNRKLFKHVDFTINEYPYDYYLQKYQDTTFNDINIDAYTSKDSHYKLWCIENEDINEEIWYKLVYLSLSNIFKPLFDEILDSNSF